MSIRHCRHVQDMEFFEAQNMTTQNEQ